MVVRRARWSWLHLLAGALAIPFVVAQNSWFEWANSLWLLQLQTAHVAAHGTPTFFIHEPDQFFYPIQLFYAGPTLSALAYPAAIVGAWPVFAATTVGAFVAASAGVGWAARSLGVPPALAVVPGLLFATTPYLVSDLYGRGAWTELVAVAAVAVAFGAATSVLAGAAKHRGATVVVLALAAATVAGTHNLTLLFGGISAALLLAALAGPLGVTSRRSWRRLALVVAAAAAGVALCGVFLVPNLWLGPRTSIAQAGYSEFTLQQTHSYDRPEVILSPLLGQPAEAQNTDLHTQAGVVALVWCAIAAGLLSWRAALERRTRKPLVALAVIAIAIVVLIANPSWWLNFPPVLESIQFTFRLVPYLALTGCLGVALMLTRPAATASRLLVGALLAGLVWQSGLAAYLAVSAKARSIPPAPTIAQADVTAAQPPPSFVGPGYGQPSQFRLVPKHQLSRPVAQASAAVGADTPSRVVLSGRDAPGTVVATRVVDSPLVRVDGDAHRIGADDQAYMVLSVDGHAHVPWKAAVVPACGTCVRALAGDAPLALLAGKLLTLIGLVAVPALALGARRPPSK